MAKKTERSDKERATDIPGWVEGEKPLSGESGREFATRLLEQKYGKGNYPKGPGSEYSKIKKFIDRLDK